MSERVLILGPAWPFRGGIAASSERLALAWQKQGAAVKMHTFTKLYPKLLFPGKTQFSDAPKPADLHIERGLHAYNPLNWPRIGRALAQAEYDIVLIRYWLPAVAPALGSVAHAVADNGRTRVVALVDNLHPHEPRLFDRWLAKRFFPYPHGFVTMAQVVQRQVMEVANGRPVEYAPHPLYDDYGPAMPAGQAREALGLPKEGKLLLFFGFIRKYKGLDLLIEALADPLIAKEDFQVVVAGEWYADPEPVKKRAVQLGVEGRLIWHDRYISDDLVAAYFSAADAVVQPYRSATQSGISALAYAYEKPLVSTDVGGLAELVDEGQTGFLAKPEPSSLATAVARWVASDAEDAMQAHIRSKRRELTWENCIEAVRRAAKGGQV